jgi:hypothetical protein
VGGAGIGGQVGRSTGCAATGWRGGLSVGAPPCQAEDADVGCGVAGSAKGCGDGGAGSSRPLPPVTESVQRGSSADHPYRPSLGSTRRSVTDVRIVRYRPNRQIRRSSMRRRAQSSGGVDSRRAERAGHADKELFSTACGQGSPCVGRVWRGVAPEIHSLCTQLCTPVQGLSTGLSRTLSTAVVEYSACPCLSCGVPGVRPCCGRSRGLVGGPARVGHRLVTPMGHGPAGGDLTSVT